MARFLLITYFLENTLMKALKGFEEIDPRYVKRSVKALEEVLPSVHAWIQDTEERVMANRLSGDFFKLEEYVALIECSLDKLAIPGKLPTSSTDDHRRLFDLNLEAILGVLNRISHSLQEIRSNRQQVESSGLGVISDDVKIVGRVDDVLKIVEFLMGSSTNHQLLHAFPIVGMAGLGKTALARSVCEKVSEGQLFDKTVWISVSDNFEELTVLREMLKALGEDMAGGADSIGETLEHLSKELIECASLESLPRNMRGLLSLRHIYFTYHHQMPVKVGHLTSLQTLPFFVVGKDSDSTIQELESLNGLRGQLSIYNLQEVKNKKEAEKANLRGKTKIYKLEFVWRSGRKCFKNDEEVLEALQPHSNLETLKIEHYGGEKLPSWLLMEIPTHAECQNESNSPLMTSVQVFNSLQYLRLEDFPDLFSIPDLQNLSLKGLAIKHCPDLEYIGSLQNLTSLEDLRIEVCPNLESIPILLVSGKSVYTMVHRANLYP
ncbi:NBS-LRR TYPE DISEASE RESISTANCE PROTEIN [Salix purpurea]|uniref:NBS-LRR TYPE DISEASE RESISTANCE PROTEIN n=1 Tax=Salix purpurea TaxID=77065 RepID=A0A9Q0V8Z3_SALPP|nr:NBS-LRR TYPE DISEASE RESISTANCE PROTEIN [Salix purpurea]